MTHYTFFFALFLSLFSASLAEARSNHTVVGWVEKVRIDLIDSTFPAKLDTGATTSSMDAKIIKIEEAKKRTHGNRGTVIFSVTDDEDRVRILERKIVRWVRIKSKTGGFLRRPVVKMSFCIADDLITEEVNLAPRENFIYPVLVGRNMMQDGKLVIDASRTYLVKPDCKKK